MACSTISTRVTIYQSILIASLIMPLFLNAGKPGLELELIYDYDKGFSLFTSGSYRTNYVETSVKVNPYKSFPDNISLKTSPVHKSNNTNTDDAIAVASAISITVVSGTLVHIAKKEIERAIENKNIDLYLQRCDQAIKNSNPTFEKMEKRIYS